MNDELPVLDFPVLSDEGRPADPQPGTTETVWRFEGDWQRGDLIGEVRIQDAGEKRFVAHFTFADFRPVTVTGEVPGDGTWIGRGRAEAEGEGRRAEVDIEGRNPKKWG